MGMLEIPKTNVSTVFSLFQEFTNLVKFDYFDQLEINPVTL